MADPAQPRSVLRTIKTHRRRVRRVSASSPAVRPSLNSALRVERARALCPTGGALRRWDQRRPRRRRFRARQRGGLASTAVPEFQTSPGMRDILPPESARWRALHRACSPTSSRRPATADHPAADRGPRRVHRASARPPTSSPRRCTTSSTRAAATSRCVPSRPPACAGRSSQHRPTTPWKVWYAGPNFRYEKPQRGRYRQFDQVGIEVLGADDPYLDVEVIALGWEFYRRLGLRQVTLLLNSLGEPDDRARYVDALRGPLRRRRRRR